jgi:hypothetical protein
MLDHTDKAERWWALMLIVQHANPQHVVAAPDPGRKPLYLGDAADGGIQPIDDDLAPRCECALDKPATCCG